MDKEILLENKIPHHIAIIMDGNGRWAKKRNLDRSQGHVEGVKRVDEVIDAAQEIGVKALTLFTFSTENWKRPETEVSMLMNILASVLKKKLSKLISKNIRFQVIGRKEKIPSPVLKIMNEVADETKNNTDLILNLAFNYGGRTEILDAIQNLISDCEDKRIKKEDIDEKLFSEYLYTKNLPDPDLLIRTSGEKRISNFLLWQLSYAEFYFSENYWPDFGRDQFFTAIHNFQQRARRYGHVVKTEHA